MIRAFRININAMITGVTLTGGATVAASNGSSIYFSAAFKPNNPSRILVT